MGPEYERRPQSENGKRRSMTILERSVINRGLGRGLTLVVVALGLFAGLLAVLAAGASAQSAQGTAPTTPPQRVYALTTNDNLLFFNGNAPRETTRVPITGLERRESLVGIDFRPANSLLYGVSNRDNIYTIDEETGVAVLVSTLSIPLEGASFGVDFNPVPDRLRIVSDADQNLRVNVDTGVVATDVTPDGDADLQYASGDPNAGQNPDVTAAAYTNSTPPSPRTPDPNVPSTGTTLYDIDFGLDVLAIQNPPNAGTLNTVGDLGDNVKAVTGFDIVTTGTTNRAFAALQAKGGGSSAFYGVDLGTGQVDRIDRIDGKRTNVEGLAIPIGQP